MELFGQQLYDPAMFSLVKCGVWKDYVGIHVHVDSLYLVTCKHTFTLSVAKVANYRSSIGQYKVILVNKNGV